MLFNLVGEAFVASEKRVVYELSAPWWVFSVVVFLVLCGLAVVTFAFVNASHRHSDRDQAPQSLRQEQSCP